ncbi:hypothetical protein EDF54_0253, partial [Rathayibacter sp. PhB93]
MLPRTPPSSRTSRSSGRPFDVAASLVLTAGLLGCIAPVASAADATSTAVGASPAPTSPVLIAPAADTSGKPPWKGTFGVFFPTPPVAVGTKISVTASLVNVGDVPLKVTIDTLPQPGGAPLDIAPGEKKTFVGETTLTEGEQRTGVWALDISVRSVRPDGSVDVTTADLRRPIPTVAPVPPTPAPTQPATPSPTQPATPAPTSSPAAENPALERTVTATFKPGPLISDESERPIRVDYTIHLENTGDVPLNVFLDAYKLPGGAPITLAVGESKDLGPDHEFVLRRELERGSWRFITAGAAYTPQGVRVDAGIDALVPVPGESPTPAPTQPATPTPAPTQPATPTPAPTQPATPSTPT